MSRKDPMEISTGNTAGTQAALGPEPALPCGGTVSCPALACVDAKLPASWPRSFLFVPKRPVRSWHRGGLLRSKSLSWDGSCLDPVFAAGPAFRGHPSELLAPGAYKALLRGLLFHTPKSL